MSEVIIDFKARVDELKPAESALDVIIKKEGEVGTAWKKASETIASSTKIAGDSSNKLAKSIQDIATAAKGMDKAAIGGAYRDYLKQIQAQLGLTSKELKTYILNARNAAREGIFAAGTDKEIDDITLSIELMNEELERLEKTEEGTVTKTTTLKQQLKEAKNELLAMADAGLQGTPAFEALRQKAGELDDRIRDINTDIKNVGSDTQAIEGVIQIAGALGGGFAVAQGSIALFAGENEELQKGLLKLNAIMSVLQGLQQIQNVLQKESAASVFLSSLARQQQTVAVQAETIAEVENVAATEAATVATTEQAAATTAATVATKGFSAALLTNPIFLLVAAVTAVAAALVAFSGKSREAREAEAEFNNAILEGTEYLEGNLRAIEHQTEKQVAGAKLRRASEEEITKIEGDNGNQRLKAIEEARGAIANAINDEKLQRQLSAEDFKKLLDKELELSKQFQDERAKLEVKAIAFRKSLADGELKAFIENEEARVLSTTTAGSDAERAAQIAKITTTQAARLKLAKDGAATEAEAISAGNKLLAEDERAIKQLQLENYQHYLKGRSSAAEAEVAKQKILLLKNQIDSIETINAITDAEIKAQIRRKEEALRSDPNLNLGETRKIVNEANLAILELERDKQAKILEIRKNSIDGQLEVAIKGTEEEYKLKEAALVTQMDIELSAAELTGQQVINIKKKFEKQREEAERQFQQAQLQNQIAVFNAEEIQFGISEDDKLQLVIQRLELQRELEILGAENNAAKIIEINAKIDQQLRQSKASSIDAVLASNLRTLEAFSANSRNAAQRILEVGKSTLEQRIVASNTLYNAELRRIDLTAAAEKKKLDAGTITQEEYNLHITELDNARTEAQISNEKRITDVTLAEAKKRTDGITAVFSIVSKSMQDTLGSGGLSVAFDEITNFGTRVKDVFDEIKAGTISTAEGMAQLVTDAVSALQSITTQIFADNQESRRNELENTIALLEEQKQKELDAKNLTEQQKRNIEIRYKEQERKEKIKAFEADKSAKRVQAGINAALGITQAFASNPFPYSLIVAGIVATATAFQIAAINKAEPPRFKTGKVKIQGPGSETSDSIHAMISHNESVINAPMTRKWEDALVAINENKFESYLANKYKGFHFPEVSEKDTRLSMQAAGIDYNKLGKVISQNIPAGVTLHNEMSENGMRTFIQKGNSITEFKNERYRMFPDKT